MSDLQIVVSENSSELAEAAAQQFVDIVTRCQAAAGTARVALSGGSTPRALFTLLASDRFRSKIDWSRIDLFWGDERTVPPDHEDSNYRMARETLISKVSIPDERVHRIRCELEPDPAASDYELQLTQVFGDGSPDQPPQFDLILLGIGSDGHTASLFPGTSALSVRDRLVVANPVPQQQTTRITLTVPVLQAAHNVLFLVAGEDKASAVHEAIEGGWNPTKTPSQFLREASGTVIWMLDTAAASQLRDRESG